MLVLKELENWVLDSYWWAYNHEKIIQPIYSFSGDDRFECLAKSFKIMDDRGVLLFSVDDQEVLVGADSLRVSGEGGTSFTGSVQTTLVRADSDLRYVSPSFKSIPSDSLKETVEYSKRFKLHSILFCLSVGLLLSFPFLID